MEPKAKPSFKDILTKAPPKASHLDQLKRDVKRKTFRYSEILFAGESLADISHEAVDVDHETDIWNRPYFEALSMPETTTQESVLKYNRLNSIHRDFVNTATTYGKTIISEYFVPQKNKTLSCAPVGGVAGGVKYIMNGILFKLAESDKGPYLKNAEYAAKAMGHEMKGANSYARCNIPDVRVALQVLIDYKGFRMHCQAFLDIGESTLKVGSSDGGKTIHTDDSILMGKLRCAASELNIAEHTVLKKHKLYSACDVEGHLAADGKYYLIDLARVFPPESPHVAYHLKRSEYLVGESVFCCHPQTGNLRQAVIVEVHDAEVGDGFAEAKSHQITYDLIFMKGKEYHERMPRSSLADNYQSIFWRLLRPEFVKHRGRELLGNFMRTFVKEDSGGGDSKSTQAPTNAPMTSAAGTAVHTSEETETDSCDNDEENDQLLPCNPDDDWVMLNANGDEQEKEEEGTGYGISSSMVTSVAPRRPDISIPSADSKSVGGVAAARTTLERQISLEMTQVDPVKLIGEQGSNGIRLPPTPFPASESVDGYAPIDILLSSDEPSSSTLIDDDSEPLETANLLLSSSASAGGEGGGCEARDNKRWKDYRFYERVYTEPKNLHALDARSYEEIVFARERERRRLRLPKIQDPPALSPDAFSLFAESGEGGAKNSNESNATIELIYGLIPALVRENDHLARLDFILPYLYALYTCLHHVVLDCLMQFHLVLLYCVLLHRM